MVALRLNPALDVATLAAQFAHDGRVRVRDILAPDSAALITDCLERATPFDIATLDVGGAPLVLAGPRIDWADPIIAAAVTRAGDRFSFVYKSFPMLTAYQKGQLPGHLLHSVFEFLNSAQVLDFLRKVTGHGDINRLDAQATLYEPGCFLTTHNDLMPAHNRRAAYVMGFTRRWQFDWGGLLLFFDEARRVHDGYMPDFNTLDLFTVPQLHAVTSVTPFAQSGRYAITGWARAPAG
jgi:SM-20-related protein